MANINAQNFLRWDDGTGASVTELPQAYIQDRCQNDFMPILVPGEYLAFYINTRYGVDYGSAPTLRLIKYGNDVSWTDSVLQKDMIDITQYNIYADFQIPVLSDGIYQFQVLNDSSAVVLTSNKVQVMNDEYQNISSYLEFTNDQNLYNVRYASLSNFYQKFRLRITDGSGPQFEPNTESYRSETSGRYRDLLSNVQKFYTFDCYYVDKDAIEAIACFLAHRTRLINEMEYSFKEGVTNQPITTKKVVKAQFQMYDQAFSTINKCSTNPVSS